MNVEKASGLMNLLSDPNRLNVVVYLKNKLHANGSELLDQVDCKQATLSHHLSSLVEAEILKSKKKGNQVIYSLNAKTFEQLVNFLGGIDRTNKTPKESTKPVVEEPKEIKEEVYRVVDHEIIKAVEEKKPNPVKVELPTYLL
ncbi:MAG: winged helix-turn-helix transcriptional regulator [Bacilli bacterium]|nr:winged helix-turn-helix transcriptional regulator [Bacilli bacterium]